MSDLYRPTDLQACIDLLAERRRTNGYATFNELVEAAGLADPDGEGPTLGQLSDLSDALGGDPRVAIQGPIGIDEPTQYRLLAQRRALASAGGRG